MAVPIGVSIGLAGGMFRGGFTGAMRRYGSDAAWIGIGAGDEGRSSGMRVCRRMMVGGIVGIGATGVGLRKSTTGLGVASDVRESPTITEALGTIGGEVPGGDGDVTTGDGLSPGGDGKTVGDGCGTGSGNGELA